MSHKANKEAKFREFVKKNLSNGLMNMDLFHDNPVVKVKTNGFYDMINEKSVDIYTGSVPDDLENFIHNELVDLVNNEENILQNLFVKNQVGKSGLNGLENYIGILDKSADNNEMKAKLEKIFQIKKFEQTFIGNCEMFLNNNSTKIFPEFMDENSNLKTEYLIESIKIGFLPIGKNKLINFNSFSKGKPLELFEELIIFNQFISESLSVIKQLKLKNEFYKDFTDELKIIKKKIGKIKKITDLNQYTNDEKLVKLVEKIVFSLKEARDIFYIEEIKAKMLSQPKFQYILITGDIIQSYRAILSNISTINLVLSIIRFMGIYNGNKLDFIGNPFELITTNELANADYIKSKTKKNIIESILANPIISLKKIGEIKFNGKYLVNNYYKLSDVNYLKTLSELFMDDDERIGIEEYSSLDKNQLEKKIHMDYLLDFAKANIQNVEELLHVFYSLRNNYEQNQNSIFDGPIEKIKLRYKKNIVDFKHVVFNNSTWQFQIFYLLTIWKGISVLSYIVPLAQKFYSNDFNWEQIELFY